MYEVNGWSKYGERDYYETGCNPEQYVSFSGDDRFSANSISDLLIKLRSFVGVDDDYEIGLDACEDTGRVDICVMETNDSYPATAWQFKEWRAGNLALWSSTYTFYVEEVQRAYVPLTKALKFEQ